MSRHVIGARRRARALTVSVAAAVLLAGCGGDGAGPTSPRASRSSTTADPVAAATARLCEDLLLIQSGFRPDALGRLVTKLGADAEAFASAGEAKAARAIRRFSGAIAKLRSALLGQRGVEEARDAVQRALPALPDC